MKQSELEKIYTDHLTWINSKNKKGKQFKLEEEDLKGLSFRNYKLNGSRFNGCTLNKCDFSHARLQNVIFEDNNLYQVSFVDTIFTNECIMGRNNLKETNFKNADLASLLIRNNYGEPINLEIINPYYPYIYFHSSNKYSPQNILHINGRTLSLTEWTIYFPQVAIEEKYTLEQKEYYLKIIHTLIKTSNS